MHCSIVLPLYGNTVHIVIVHHWYCYYHNIVPVIEIIWILIVINNNVNWQLTLGLGKLIEETTSVFWVNLGYRLRSRDTVQLQGSGGWQTSRIIHIVIIIDILLLLLTYCYCYWLPSGRTWFNVRWLGRGSGYVRNLPKAWTISLLLISVT